MFVFLVVVIILGIIFWALWFVQNKNLFNPTHDCLWEPNEDCFVLNNTGKEKEIKNFYIGQNHCIYFNQYPGRPVILFCHGNNANLSYREYAYIMSKTLKFNLLLWDYRGYGKSKGYPTQDNICSDGEHVYRWLIEQGHISRDIIIWGESLGGAVATSIAAKHVCRCLILFSTFSSIDDIVTKNYDIHWCMKNIAHLASWFLNTLPNKMIIHNVTEPVLVIHSPKDGFIPITNAYKLYDSIKHDNKEFLEIGGTHARPNMSLQKFRRIYDFCMRGEEDDHSITDGEVKAMLDAIHRAAEKCGY